MGSRFISYKNVLVFVSEHANRAMEISYFVSAKYWKVSKAILKQMDSFANEKLFQIQMGTHKLFAYRWAYAPLACLPLAQKRGFNFEISIVHHTAIFSLFLSGCPQSFSRQLNITLIVKLLSNGLCTIVEKIPA